MLGSWQTGSILLISFQKGLSKKVGSLVFENGSLVADLFHIQINGKNTLIVALMIEPLEYFNSMSVLLIQSLGAADSWLILDSLTTSQIESNGLKLSSNVLEQITKNNFVTNKVENINKTPKNRFSGYFYDQLIKQNKSCVFLLQLRLYIRVHIGGITNLKNSLCKEREHMDELLPKSQIRRQHGLYNQDTNTKYL